LIIIDFGKPDARHIGLPPSLARNTLCYSLPFHTFMMTDLHRETPWTGKPPGLSCHAVTAHLHFAASHVAMSQANISSSASSSALTLRLPVIVGGSRYHHPHLLKRRDAEQPITAWTADEDAVVLRLDVACSLLVHMSYFRSCITLDPDRIILCNRCCVNAVQIAPRALICSSRYLTRTYVIILLHTLLSQSYN